MNMTPTLSPKQAILKLDEVKDEPRPELSSQFAGKRYISLETFKRNGEGIKTPVWFVQQNDRLYIWTADGSGKAKRIRNNPKVRIAPCSVTGKPKGTWIHGEARILPAAELVHKTDLFKKKYTLQFWVTAHLNKSKRAIIELDTERPKSDR